MKKSFISIMAVAVTAVTIFSCNNTRNSEAYRLLADVEKHVWDKPDSALLILQNIDPSNLFSKELESNMIYIGGIWS